MLCKDGENAARPFEGAAYGFVFHLNGYAAALHPSYNYIKGGEIMKKQLRKPCAKRVKVMTYGFESCSQSASFAWCGLKW